MCGINEFLILLTSYFIFVDKEGCDYYLVSGTFVLVSIITTHWEGSALNERAMADEFERNRYRERIRAKIADEVRKIDFSEKFTFVAQARLGEYSFGSHSFPIVWLGEWLCICIGPQSYTGNCTSQEASGFRAKDAVNGNDFNWSVPMSETDASAFVKSRSTASPGEVDRRITVRITYSVMNKRPAFSPFIYSVEAFGDESLTRKLAVIPKINSLGASTAEEWRLATEAAQTPAKKIGEYQYLADYRKEGYFNPDIPVFGTITLTDVDITLSVGQPDGRNSKKQRFSFFDSFASLRTNVLWRSNFKNIWKAKTGPANLTHWEEFVVVWQPFWKDVIISPSSPLRFISLAERDRFFVDLTNAIQEWKTKFARFQFAAGRLNIEQRCEVGDRFVSCSETTLSNGKPVWQTPSYKVTVESLERNGNDYVVTLEFENLTDKTIKIAWQEKSGVVPDATGPYLIDESGEKYFAKGTDSGNILQDTMNYLWVPLPKILPQAKLKSRFVFSGNGDGKMFTLKAKEMLQDLGDRLVTIDGLKITSP